MEHVFTSLVKSKVPTQLLISLLFFLESERKKQGTFLPIIVKFRLMNRLRAATRLDRAGRVAVIALVVTILCWSPYYFLKASRAIQILLVSIFDLGLIG